MASSAESLDQKHERSIDQLELKLYELESDGAANDVVEQLVSDKPIKNKVPVRSSPLAIGALWDECGCMMHADEVRVDRREGSGGKSREVFALLPWNLWNQSAMLHSHPAEAA